MPIKIDAIIILTNLTKKKLLKLKRHLFFRKINNKIALNQDDIVVAIGMIINPTSLKKIILTNIFNKTEVKEI